MRNLWIQTDTEFATWLADITPLVLDPEKLLTLLGHIAMIGVEHQVFVAEPSLTPDALRLRWEAERTIDCNLRRGRRAFAQVAWFDADEQQTEGLVDDLGELLRILEPVPGSINEAFMERGLPPLDISGWKVLYTGTPPAAQLSTDIPRTIGFSLYSDIWFPYVEGSAHPRRHRDRLFDNRELASRHTPRLNRFLAETKAAVIEAGGMWATDDDARSDRMAPWIGPHGIRLDGPVPELIPPEALDAPWTA